MENKKIQNSQVSGTSLADQIRNVVNAAYPEVSDLKQLIEDYDAWLKRARMMPQLRHVYRKHLETFVPFRFSRIPFVMSDPRPKTKALVTAVSRILNP